VRITVPAHDITQPRRPRELNACRLATRQISPRRTMAGFGKQCYSLYMQYTPLQTMCPRCRSVMSSDAVACPSCGYVSSGVRASRRSTIGSLTIVFGVSGLLLVVVLLGATGVFVVLNAHLTGTGRTGTPWSSHSLLRRFNVSSGTIFGPSGRHEATVFRLIVRSLRNGQLSCAARLAKDICKSGE
jgi:hypothetical protein